MMERLFITVLSLSLSGSLLMLPLLLCRPLYRERLSKRWQYYIWLVVAVRLLLPFAPGVGPVGALFREASGASISVSGEHLPPADGRIELPSQGEPLSPEEAAPAAGGTALRGSLWMAWLGVALALLIRKATAYQSFCAYIRAGWQPVEEPEQLDCLARLGEKSGVRGPVELCVNPLAASPLLLGLRRPCIVLPSSRLPEEDFCHTVRHELVHFRRKDLLYKWLVQLIVCVHWFNPLVWWMSREVDRACELSCDEMVLGGLEPEERQAYGDTLLRAAGEWGGWQSVPVPVALQEGGERLKERLAAIQSYRQGTKGAALVALLLTALLAAAAIGTGCCAGAEEPPSAVLPVAKTQPAPSPPEAVYTQPEEPPASAPASLETETWAQQTEQYYKEGSVSKFAAAFRFLGEEEQRAAIAKAYADEQIAAFGAAVSQLDQDVPLVAEFAEQAYEDGRVNFFSVLTGKMGEELLQEWLVRASRERKMNFQAVMMQALGKDQELERLKEEKDQERLDEYKSYGVTKEGKSYYYQGQLVRVFLDMEGNRAFYTLENNPLGVVDVKITRGTEGKIQTIGYMEKEEAEALFREDFSQPDELAEKAGQDWETTILPVEVQRVEGGTWLWLGTYALQPGDQVSYNLQAKKGERMAAGFAQPGTEAPNTTFHTVNNRRQGEELAFATGLMAWKAPAGEYRLFIHAPEEGLEGIQGQIVIRRRLDTPKNGA